MLRLHASERTVVNAGSSLAEMRVWLSRAPSGTVPSNPFQQPASAVPPAPLSRQLSTAPGLVFSWPAAARATQIAQPGPVVRCRERGPFASSSEAAQIGFAARLQCCCDVSPVAAAAPWLCPPGPVCAATAPIVCLQISRRNSAAPAAPLRCGGPAFTSADFASTASPAPRRQRRVRVPIQ